MRIQAYSLSEAYLKASVELGVSAADVNVEIITKPSAGFLGFFKKLGEFEVSTTKRKVKDFKKPAKEDFSESRFESKAQSPAPKPEIKSQSGFKPEPNHFESKENLEFPSKKPERSNVFKAYDNIIDNFNASNENKPEEPKEMPFVKKAENKQGGELNTEILNEIESGLKTLFGASDFKIHIEEVSKYDENSVYIKLDGEDCALLIGKEGYRYKALSSLLYNWINSKYNLNVRLEIAEFLKNQEAGMRVYLEGIIRRVEETGHANTKPLDGVLIKIALEQLRERFKDKYVGIKNSEEGKYIIINDFHSR